MNAFTVEIAAAVRRDPLLASVFERTARAWLWLKWKLLCLAWRLEPGYDFPCQIRWPRRLPAEPSI